MFRRTPLLACVIVLVALASLASSQQPDAQRGRSLTLLSRDGRQSLAVTMVNDRQMVALNDLATVFRLTVREDTLASGVTVTYQDSVIVLTATQGLASVGGRVVSLPSPPVLSDRGWLVPVEFINRALALVLDTRLQVRRGSDLVIIGELRVPQIDVRYAQTGDQSRVIFEMTPATPHTIDQEQERLLVKFDADAIDVTLPDSGSGSLVSGVHTVEQPTWVAIDLGPAFGSFRASVLTGSGGSTRLVVNVLASAAPATEAAGPATASGSAAAPGTTSTTPPLDLTPAPTLTTVVIDPGHGGDETGTRGPTGVLEKDVTMQVARLLKRTIESRLGLRVVLTRDGNDMVRLDERAAIANNNKADLFISLHVNASVSPTAGGAEVYHLSLDEYGDAARRAGSEERTVPVIGGGTRNIEVVLWDMAQVRHVDQSAAFAEIVTAELRRRVDVSQRALQQAPFRVLVGANMPAVLIEMGFMSNPTQERQLASGSFQNAIVQALFQSVVRYRDRLRGRQSAEVSRGSGRPPVEERP